ncbi:DEAD/DEAH box helicase [Candidatus Woesearchaeota archaeon]|nr:DEAD/DEAH box helicase [Candidatus Woesearchaeota archaeon]
MIKNFAPRLYQQTIFATASQKNTLVVLPTGLGKTNIFLMLAAHRLRLYPDSKILFIGPTRPLIDQYKQVFVKHFDLPEDKLATFTGNVSPAKRAELWKTSTIIFSTPQGLENDIINKQINLEEVSLLGVDEAHRAVGDYAYNFIAKQYDKLAKYPRILALTASPGSDMEKIMEVCKNLYIEEIEIRTENDPDVKPYIQEVDITWIPVELPTSFQSIQKFLKDCFRTKLHEIKKLGFITREGELSRKDMLSLQGHLQHELAQGNKSFEVLKSLSYAAEAMKVQHAIELIETQGIHSLHAYMEKLMEESRTSKVKAVQNLVMDLHFRSAYTQTKNMFAAEVDHPKLTALKKVLQENLTDDSKIIIFTQYRDSGAKIMEQIGEIPGVKAGLFVGQANKNGSGLTQKKQLEMMQQFKDGIYNVIVATCVAEEGLDIPQVDAVIFYEPVPSAIRTIQRRGRTGRQEKGKVLMLFTKNTRDEAYRWVAHHKEKRMYRNLADIRSKLKLTLSKPKAETLVSYMDYKPKIFVDYREKGSGVIKELIELGADVRMEQLEIADYVCSGRCGIEYKTVHDFVDSLIDGRLLNQVKDLKHRFDRPFIIVEGIENIYAVRKVHPNAIAGLLATIAVSFGIPLMFTRTTKESANLILATAKREQEEGGLDFNPHGSKKPPTLKEQQEYIVSALPNIGPVLAKQLLKDFSTVKNIINADVEQLKLVEGIGEKLAARIKEVVEKDYEK